MPSGSLRCTNTPFFHKDLLRGTSQAVVLEVALEKSAGDGEVLVEAWGSFYRKAILV